MCSCFKYGTNEPLLIKEIVKDILNKLIITHSSDNENLVGMDARIQEMEMLLSLESDDVRMVGIWGMGGIGKQPLSKLFIVDSAMILKVAPFLKMLQRILK